MICIYLKSQNFRPPPPAVTKVFMFSPLFKDARELGLAYIGMEHKEEKKQRVPYVR
jgi:hypothetical protein